MAEKGGEMIWGGGPRIHEGLPVMLYCIRRCGFRNMIGSHETKRRLIAICAAVGFRRRARLARARNPGMIDSGVLPQITKQAK